jgi:hypothetical protein
MITNHKHISEGYVRLTLQSGEKIEAVVGFNDPHNEVLWLLLDGDSMPLPYGEVASASIPLRQ